MNDSSNPIDDFYASGILANNKNIYDAYLMFSEKLKSISAKRVKSNKWNLFKEYYSSSNRNFLFRRGIQTTEFSSTLWVLQVREAANLILQALEVPKYRVINESYLVNIAKRSESVNGIKEIGKFLSSTGIILVINEQIPGMKTDGAVFVLDSGNPVIALTLRYPRIDYFWFTLLHELSHICLHYDKLNNIILDDLDDLGESEIELDADYLALESFVPSNKWRNARLKYQVSEKAVIELANEMKIHPAIIAGRYRKENNNYAIFSDIVNKINIRDIFYD